MYISAFDLYRVGPGPSSVYTLGPQRAALRFVHDLAADGLVAATARVEVELYGGLAFHGREHASDQAIVAGLSGQVPERCDGAVLASCMSRVQAEHRLRLGGRGELRFDPATDLRRVVNRSLAYDGNALRFAARDAHGDVVASRLYFSTGNGTVLAEGDTQLTTPPRVPYPYGSADALQDACLAQGKRICDLVRANECALRSPGEVRAGLLRIAQSMRKAVERGLTAGGTLPGGEARAAPAAAAALRPAPASPSQRCATYATAVAEENASGGRVVAAPSAGAAGPVAALLESWCESAPLQQDDRIIDFLLAGAAVGGLLRANGVVQVGCQGEIGVAAAMAAAGLASVHNGSNAQVLHAAEHALAPHLGLSCDPRGGRIEDPCIGRNAIAAARAYDAAMAAIHQPSPRVGLDLLLRSIVEAGHAMAGRYKTESIGALATNVAEC
ncbi:MAG: L-serine ammonia-lyase [Burkholderiales bacterium]|nr:L-serine ammonia-lyase [Burkholderiales bacterium]